MGLADYYSGTVAHSSTVAIGRGVGELRDSRGLAALTTACLDTSVEDEVLEEQAGGRHEAEFNKSFHQLSAFAAAFAVASAKPFAAEDADLADPLVGVLPPSLRDSVSVGCVV